LFLGRRSKSACATIGKEPLDEFLMKREDVPLDVSIIYGLIEER